LTAFTCGTVRPGLAADRRHNAWSCRRRACSKWVIRCVRLALPFGPSRETEGPNVHLQDALARRLARRPAAFRVLGAELARRPGFEYRIVEAAYGDKRDVTTWVVEPIRDAH
jgi:hypothetical protein